MRTTRNLKNIFPCFLFCLIPLNLSVYRCFSPITKNDTCVIITNFDVFIPLSTKIFIPLKALPRLRFVGSAAMPEKNILWCYIDMYFISCYIHITTTKQPPEMRTRTHEKIHLQKHQMLSDLRQMVSRLRHR